MTRHSLETIDGWEFDGIDEVWVGRHEMLPRDYGEYYRAADVDTLLARIRAAVMAEGRAADKYRWEVFASAAANCGSIMERVAEDELKAARAALDALLSDGETVHQCPPDGSRTTPCCGRIPFDLIGDRMATDPSLVTCTGWGGR